jgi:hypothetical protein
MQRRPKPEKEKKKKNTRASNAQLVKKAIQAFGNKVDEKNVTVGEFVRLLELQKQMGGDEPKEIKVTWVDPTETEPSSEK